jgi:hypothetical protein
MKRSRVGPKETIMIEAIDTLPLSAFLTRTETAMARCQRDMDSFPTALSVVYDEANTFEPTMIPRSVLVAVAGIETLAREMAEDCDVENGALIDALKNEALADIRRTAMEEFAGR